MELCLAEPEDEMTQKQLVELQAVLDTGWRSVEAGRFRPAEEVLAELRARSASEAEVARKRLREVKQHDP